MGKYSKFIKYLCIKCKKEISYSGARHGAIVCRNCYYDSLKGKGNPMFGRRFAKHFYCIDCNKEINRGYKRCHSCAMKYLLKTNKKLAKYNKNKFGINNPNWKGGISFLPYSSEFNEQLKDQIRKRDNYECKNCGLTNEEHLLTYDESLPVHHIDYNKQNCKENNLITLCKQCNVRANYNRIYWQEFYTSKIMEIIHVQDNT